MVQRGWKNRRYREVITSTDIVAADAYAATFFKHPKTGKPFKPEEIKFVKNAYDLGLGEIDLSKVRVKKVTLPDESTPLRKQVFR